MQINFVGRHIEVTPALKEHTTEKLKSLEKRDHHISHINVVFHIERTLHIAEGTVILNGAEIHARAEEDDMYKAVDILATKLITQVTKHKDKLIDSHR